MMIQKYGSVLSAEMIQLWIFSPHRGKEKKYMNVYGIDIWRSVKHNGKFSHTVTRFELVHALNEERAKKKITLAKGCTWGKEPTVVETSDEFIYAIRKSGVVTKQMYYVYSDGRTPRPVVKPK